MIQATFLRLNLYFFTKKYTLSFSTTVHTLFTLHNKSEYILLCFVDSWLWIIMFSHQFWEPLLMGIASKSKVFFTTLLVENWTQILSLVGAFFSGFDRVPQIPNGILPLCSHVKWSKSFTNNIYYSIHVLITNVVGCKIEMQMQYSLFFPLVLTFSDKISTFAIDCKLYARLIEKRG